MEKTNKDNAGQEQAANSASDDAALAPEIPAGEPSAPDVLQKKLEEALKSADSFKNQFLRKAAEFENYKRRTDAEFGALVRSANEELLYALIPVMEDFARSFKSHTAAGEGDAFTRGIELIYQKFTKVLEQQGLVPFESLGKPFNVDFHDALLQMPQPGTSPGIVIDEVERGYMLHDRVLRHAKVVVSSQAESDDEGATGDSDGAAGN
jgi:molecular chaperone GrpE